MRINSRGPGPPACAARRPPPFLPRDRNPATRLHNTAVRPSPWHRDLRGRSTRRSTGSEPPPTPPKTLPKVRRRRRRGPVPSVGPSSDAAVLPRRGPAFASPFEEIRTTPSNPRASPSYLPPKPRRPPLQHGGPLQRSRLHQHRPPPPLLLLPPRPPHCVIIIRVLAVFMTPINEVLK